MVHVYVDETKAKGYLVVAAVVAPHQMGAARRQIGDLVLPGQRSLHMKHEQTSRKRQIADAICRLGAEGIRVVVYDAGRDGTERDRRARCLAALVDDLMRQHETHLVLDLDETQRSWDRQQLVELTRGVRRKPWLTYEHRHRHEEPLLALPDTIAWCWAKGGDWRRRIAPIVSGVRRV